MSTLTNKSYKNYSYISRYTPVPYYYNKKDNKYVYGVPYYLDNTTVYTIHVVKDKETFDSLADYYYGNPTLYWIICSYNHIQDPYKVPKAGSTLKIPSISNIDFDKNGRF